METKEKRNTGLVVAIILLVVALLGSVGYIVYDKVSSKDKTITTEQDENNKEQEKTKKSEKITYKEAIDFINGTSSSDQSSLMMIVKSEDTDITDVKKYVNNLDNQTKLVPPENKESFTAEELKENIEKVWGFDVNYTDENIKCQCGDDNYIYNSNTEVYNINQEHGGHGGIGKTDAYINVIDIENKNNNYTLLVKKVFYLVPDVGPITSLYKTKSDIKEEMNKLYEFDSNEINSNISIEEIINKHDLIKDLNTYKYTFTKQNGTISLISYEIVK